MRFNFLFRPLLCLFLLIYTVHSVAQKPEAKTHFTKGQEQLELENYKSAVASYRKAIAVEPNYEDALSGLGYALLQLEDHAGAKPVYDKLVKLFPGKSKYLVAYGATLFNLNDKKGAMDFYNKAIKIDPKND